MSNNLTPIKKTVGFEPSSSVINLFALQLK